MEGKARGGQREWWYLGHTHLLANTGEVLWVIWMKRELFDSNKNEWDLGELCAVSLKGCLRIRTTWDAEGQLTTSTAGEEHQKFLFSCYFASCYQVHVLTGTVGIRSKYLEAAWLHKTDASVAISWNSLNKLSTILYIILIMTTTMSQWLQKGENDTIYKWWWTPSQIIWDLKLVRKRITRDVISACPQML